jgi:hexosaminidase
LTAAAQHHRVIMTPESHLYFDYYQSLHPEEPLAAGGYTPLQKVYNYQPARSLPDSLWPYVAGVEGQAWSEYFTSEAQAKYMIFPRAWALAELAWSPAAQRNYSDFLVRLRKQPAYRNWSEKIYRPPLTLHKAIGAKVTLTHAPIERFNPGAAVLVNGISGSNRYNDNQWVGTGGEDLEAVIDLGNAQTIRSVSTHILNYHWQRMWAPVVLEVWLSRDGVAFDKVFTQTDFPINGINTVKAAFKPVSVKFVKVKAVSKGVIPAGEYGAGGKALLLMDEIIVN